MAEIGLEWIYRHRPRRAGRSLEAARRDPARHAPERSTFLAEFEDLHGVDSPDVLPSLAEATSGQPLIRTKSVDDAPTSPSEKPSMGAVLTRALHANALALSRALRFPAPRADSLEEAARSVRQEAPPSPARLEKIQPWTGQKAQTPRTKERSASPRLEDEEKWESVQDKLSSQDPRLKEAREVVPTSRLSKPGAAPTLQRPAPVYVSVASRGAATAQQRREFDRAARIASAKRAAVPPTPKKAALAIDAEAAAAAAAAAMAGPPPSPSQNPEQAPGLKRSGGGRGRGGRRHAPGPGSAFADLLVHCGDQAEPGDLLSAVPGPRRGSIGAARRLRERVPGRPMFVALLSSRGADARPAPRPSHAVAPSVISEATTARGSRPDAGNPKAATTGAHRGAQVTKDKNKTRVARGGART